MRIEEFVRQARQDRASDIHLVRGLTPRYRVDGSIREMGNTPLTGEDCAGFARELAGEEFTQAEAVGEADLALTVAGVRCRINLFRQQGVWSTALRLLNEASPTDAVLTLKAYEAFAKAADGKATKIIVPSNIQGMAGLAASLKELMADK